VNVEFTPEINAATLRVRKWFRRQLMAKLKPYKIGKRGNRVIQPNVGYVPQKIREAKNGLV
jgi:hypothetical protein